jgi:mRNA interferase MazF
VFVVQSDDFNRSTIRTVLCVALTSNLRLAAAPGNLRLASRASGLPKASVANVSQVLTVDRTRLTERVKSLDPHTMRRLDDGLRLVMNL